MKSMIVESIHEIFFSRFILNGNELTLLLKHLCLLFFTLPTFTRARDRDKSIGRGYIGLRSEKRCGGKIERDISQWWVRKISYIDSLWDWFVIVEAMRIGDEYFVTSIYSVYIFIQLHFNSSFLYLLSVIYI